MTRRFLIPLAVVVVAFAGAAAIVATGPEVVSETPKDQAPLVRVKEVSPERVELSVTTHGTVAPRTESDLVPQVSGLITWVSPSFVSGGFFEDQEALFRIDPRDYEVSLERARAQLARSESEHQRARKELARMRGLQKRSAASASAVEDAENAERIAAAVLREAEAVLEQAERDLERTEVRAPYAGRVREESLGEGQFVTRGTPVAKLYAIDYVEVRLPIPDSQLAFLDLGLWGGPLSPDAGPEVELVANFAGSLHTWRGRVVRTEGEIDAKSRMVHVVARVEDPYVPGEDPARPPLAVGLFVRAEIAGIAAENVVVLPRSAMLSDDQVLVVDAEDRLRFRRVEVLRARRSDVLIEAGLAPGERVCVSPLEAPVEGMRVRTVPDAESMRVRTVLDAESMRVRTVPDAERGRS